MTAHHDVDFGRRSDDYAAHRPGFPPWFYERLATFQPIAGATAVDLGTGPGTVAIELARRGARVTGIDVAPNQIAVATRVASACGVADACAFQVAAAESTGLPASSADLVFAGQCWHWFDHARALAEVRRLLRPSGLLVVAHYSYLAAHSALVRATEALVLELNPGWTMAGSDGMFPGHVDSLQEGGFSLVEQFCRDHDEPFTHEGWRGRMRTCNGVGSGAMSEQLVAEFDARLARLLARDYPHEPLQIPHRVWATIVRR